jgi:excisionase family DNA binding protein
LVRALSEFFVELEALDAHSSGMNMNACALPHSIQDRGDGAVLVTVREATHRLAIGRSTLYLLIAAGELEVIHIGRAVRVPVDSITAFIARRRSPERSAPARGDR